MHPSPTEFRQGQRFYLLLTRVTSYLFSTLLIFYACVLPWLVKQIYPFFDHRTPTARCTWLSPNLLGETWAKLHTALSIFTSLTSINPFILSLVPEAQGCRLCPELIRSQIAGGLSPYCAPSSGIILVLILTAYPFFFHLSFHFNRISSDCSTVVTSTFPFHGLDSWF